MKDYLLVLGSNCDRPFGNIMRAVGELERFCEVVRRSSYYISEPCGRDNVPWYVNVGVLVRTDEDPEDLLMRVKEIERALGRKFSGWQLPRAVDIDLAAGSVRCDEEHLKIPHPRLGERKFMLMPIVEIAPDFEIYEGVTARELLDSCEDDGKVMRL